jgi:hypothetical protein
MVLKRIKVNREKGTEVNIIFLLRYNWFIITNSLAEILTKVVVNIYSYRYILTMQNINHVSKSIGILLIGIVVLLITSCSSYTYQSNYSLNEVVEASVIKNDGVFILSPEGVTPDTGIIFYPGGLVKPEAYTPIAWNIAKEASVTVVIVSMPFDLAVFAPGKGLDVLDMMPEITEWYIAGHSLGGAMASTLIFEEPEIFKGLFLFGAYPDKKKPLTNTNIPVLSFYSEFDGLATIEKIQNTKSLLPESTQFVYIEGGNHAQFGSYGTQKDDGAATITPEEQWGIVSRQISEFIRNN